MDTMTEPETDSRDQWRELLKGAIIHWPTLPETSMESELTDQEIREIRESLTHPVTKFWDYVEFARQVIKAHEEKQWKNEQQNNGQISSDSMG